jgi:hypothetical protein
MVPGAPIFTFPIRVPSRNSRLEKVFAFQITVRSRAITEVPCARRFCVRWGGGHGDLLVFNPGDFGNLGNYGNLFE